MRLTQILDQKNDQAFINQPEFKVPVNPLKRLKEALYISCFYDNFGRDILHPNMIWNQVINNFMIQRKAMRKKGEG